MNAVYALILLLLLAASIGQAVRLYAHHQEYSKLLHFPGGSHESDSMKLAGWFHLHPTHIPLDHSALQSQECDCPKCPTPKDTSKDSESFDVSEHCTAEGFHSLKRSYESRIADYEDQVAKLTAALDKVTISREKVEERYKSQKKGYKQLQDDASSGVCRASVAQARSSLQDRLVQLMASNVVSHMSAYCANAEVPSVRDVDPKPPSRCKNEIVNRPYNGTFIRDRLDTLKEQEKYLITEDEGKDPATTEASFLLRSLLAAKYAAGNSTALPSTIKEIPEEALGPLIEQFQERIMVDDNVHSQYINALRNAAPAFLDKIEVFQQDPYIRSRFMVRNPVSERVFAGLYKFPDNLNLNRTVAEDEEDKALGRKQLTREEKALLRAKKRETKALQSKGLGATYTYKTCALVGNAQRMLLNTAGAEINDHEVVLRLNNAPTVGYETFVGNKTTHRLINNQWTREYGSQDGLPLESNVTLVMSRTDPALVTMTSAVLTARREDVGIVVMTREGVDQAGKLLRALRAQAENIRGAVYPGKGSPSSGFVGVYLLLQLCSKVDVYGVALSGCYGDNCNKGNTAWHYWQEETFKTSREFGDDPHHSFELEHDMLRVLDAGDYLAVRSPQVAADVVTEVDKLSKMMPKMIAKADRELSLAKQSAHESCKYATGAMCGCPGANLVSRSASPSLASTGRVAVSTINDATIAKSKMVGGTAARGGGAPPARGAALTDSKPRRSSTLKLPAGMEDVAVGGTIPPRQKRKKKGPVDLSNIGEVILPD